MTRRDELSDNYARIRDEVAAAAQSAGRNLADVHIIAVTKTWPASDIRLLAELGLHDIGESRHQEASSKFDELNDLDLTWHFIGQLQTNKVNQVARYADVIHSVDRPKLATALGKAAVAANRTISVLIQVSLDETQSAADSERGGVLRSQVLELADLIAGTPGLTLGGVMAVAPLDEQPAAAFARLTPVVAQLQSRYPTATMVSAGMSGDFQEAIAAGATHLRIGSALLGSRPFVG